MEKQNQDNRLAIAGMILGIISILGSCIFGIYGLLSGIVGLIVSILSRKHSKSGMGVAGIVCSIIGILLSILMLLMAGMFQVIIEEMMKDPMYQEMLNEIMPEIK